MKNKFKLSIEQLQHPSDPTARSLDPQTSVLARLRHWAAVDPDRTFLWDSDGARRSYGETQLDISRWSRALQQRGVTRGDRVVSLLPSSIDAALLWLACAQLGVIAVPVNRELRGEFLRHPLRDTAPLLCFVRPEDYALIVDLPEMASVPIVTIARDHLFATDCEPLHIETLPQPEDIASIIYTSGTTGAAKGALITWAQLNTTIDRIPFGALSASDVCYAPWPMFHITGLTPLVSMAYFGGAVVFREKLSVSHFWDDVYRFNCTTATVGTAAPLLLALPEKPNERENPLRYVFGSAVAHISLEFQRRFDVQLAWTYGSTEIGFPILHADMSADNADVAGWLRQGYIAKICDPEGNDLGLDKAGELWIKPPHPALIFAGYYNRPEATAAAKIDGWYRTGDNLIRRSSDLGFRFVDRIRDTIRRFGENLSSTALENTVAGDIAVTECCAFGIASDIAGQEVALVISSPEAAPDLDAFFARLTQVLPKHMLPGFILVTTEFPKTPTGKIQKNIVAANFDKSAAWRSPAAVREG